MYKRFESLYSYCSVKDIKSQDKIISFMIQKNGKQECTQQREAPSDIFLSKLQKRYPAYCYSLSFIFFSSPLLFLKQMRVDNVYSLTCQQSEVSTEISSLTIHHSSNISPKCGLLQHITHNCQIYLDTAFEE